MKRNAHIIWNNQKKVLYFIEPNNKLHNGYTF